MLRTTDRKHRDNHFLVFQRNFSITQSNDDEMKNIFVLERNKKGWRIHKLIYYVVLVVYHVSHRIFLTVRHIKPTFCPSVSLILLQYFPSNFAAISSCDFDKNWSWSWAWQKLIIAVIRGILNQCSVSVFSGFNGNATIMHTTFLKEKGLKWKNR